MAKTGKRKLSLIFKVIIALIVFVMLIGGYSSYQIYDAVYQPHVILKGKETAFFYVHTGWKMEDVMNSLYEKNYIANRSVFEWLAERKNYKNHVYPGRYLLKKKMSNNEIINLLRSGKQSPVVVTTDMARSLQDIASMFGHVLEADSAKIIDLLKDKEYISKFGFDSRTLMSMFIANTYKLNWNTSAEQFFERMYKEYRKFWNENRKEKLEELNFTPVEATTLASIIEMESKKKDEKPVIAGVYINRLRKDMFLQADPTIIFATGDFTVKRVLKKHLEINSPYNTYIHLGLPPGPICIPSISSIDAVLDYDKNNYIYFCAKDDFSGYHNFSETYAQHAINARKYQNALNRNNIKK
ncbi:MAG: endolytic transglycosylase MltG [Bacteroidia bacterium]|nr:endolytic transglycosylase MltG [Bacteroidia bacterium]